MTAIRMRLFCEKCHAQHIDLGEFATKLHHTHQCNNCGMCWRPAVENTVGVRYLYTPDLGDFDVTPEMLEKLSKAADTVSKQIAQTVAHAAEFAKGHTYVWPLPICDAHQVGACQVCMVDEFYEWQDTARAYRQEWHATPVHERFDLGGEA